MKLKNILSNNNNIIAQHNFSTRILCQKEFYSLLKEKFFLNPQAIFNDRTSEIIKHDHATTVILTTIGQHKFVIKRYNIRSLSYRLKRCLRPTRAIRSWIYAHLLTQLNIPAIKPVAILENRWGPLRGASYFVSKYIPHTGATDYFAQQKYPIEQKKIELKKIAAEINLLHKHHIVHGDLKLDNILLTDNGPLFTDLDRIKQYRSTNYFFKRALKREYRILQSYPLDNPALQQFLQNELHFGFRIQDSGF